MREEVSSLLMSMELPHSTCQVVAPGAVTVDILLPQHQVHTCFPAFKVPAFKVAGFRAGIVGRPVAPTLLVLVYLVQQSAAICVHRVHLIKGQGIFP